MVTINKKKNPTLRECKFSFFETIASSLLFMSEQIAVDFIFNYFNKKVPFIQKIYENIEIIIIIDLCCNMYNR